MFQQSKRTGVFALARWWPCARFKFDASAETSRMRRAVAGTFALLSILLLGYLFYVAKQIERQSSMDQAQPADVILVLGAAEYRGKPSPVLKARLDHALALYKRGLAPYVLTTGGAGGDPVYTEGEVGRAYLTQNGVPSEAILVEPEGATTAQSVDATIEAHLSVYRTLPGVTVPVAA